nr:MAG TPA: hypothetical protein [Caudoviricetes sp.]
MLLLKFGCELTMRHIVSIYLVMMLVLWSV